jgi:hypothetical protein
MAINWRATGKETPPTKQRLLLIYSAAGDPTDGPLMGKSEFVLGYWTGDHYRAFSRAFPDNIAVKSTHWATLDLPRGVILQPRSEFR